MDRWLVAYVKLSMLSTAISYLMLLVAFGVGGFKLVKLRRRLRSGGLLELVRSVVPGFAASSVPPAVRVDDDPATFTGAPGSPLSTTLLFLEMNLSALNETIAKAECSAAKHELIEASEQIRSAIKRARAAWAPELDN